MLDCTSTPIEELAMQIGTMHRESCIYELKNFDGIPLDFTDHFLQRMSVEELRHVLMAAALTVYRQSHQHPAWV